jgi:Fe-S-cluster containining protein
LSKTFFLFKGAQLSLFYDQGLRFTCQSGCRYCCAVEPGFVFLSYSDIEKLIKHLQISSKQFLEEYCRKVPFGSFDYVSLNERPNHDCIFLNEKGCSVYQARPVQCLTYPFWATVLDSKKSWEEEKKWCPGIDVGTLHTKKEIENYLEMRRGVEPAIWDKVLNF